MALDDHTIAVRPSRQEAAAPPAPLVPTDVLARLLLRHAAFDGVHDTAISGVAVIRASRPGDEMLHTLHHPAVCLIAQGSKRVMLRDEVYGYDASRFLVFSVDLPISAQVLDASPEAPYLCLRIDLDPARIAAMLLEAPDLAPRRIGSERGLHLSATTHAMVDAAVRLLRLLDTPDDARTLAPLAIQELIYRVLRSEEGGRLVHIAQPGTHAARVARAIAWLKTNLAEPLRIDELAQRLHMSPSSLHHHFKTVTAMSPLQYQKHLRLIEARRLLYTRGVDVADAAYRVGYESASQFSREYSRLFGVAPSRDQPPG